MKRCLIALTVSVFAFGALPALAGCGACGGGHGHGHGGGNGKGEGRGTAQPKAEMRCESGACAVQPGAKRGAKSAAEKHGMPTISTASLKVLLDTTDTVTVLDARTGKYDDGRRLPGAEALSPSSSAAEMKAAIPSKDALVVTYCSNPKCPASAHLAKALWKHGYTNVIKYPQGIEGWIEAGHPIETVE